MCHLSTHGPILPIFGRSPNCCNRCRHSHELVSLLCTLRFMDDTSAVQALQIFVPRLLLGNLAEMVSLMKGPGGFTRLFEQMVRSTGLPGQVQHRGQGGSRFCSIFNVLLCWFSDLASTPRTLLHCWCFFQDSGFTSPELTLRFCQGLLVLHAATFACNSK